MGRRRIGLAVTDPGRILALPLELLVRTSPRADIDALLRAIDERGVAVLVVGIPVREDGSQGRIAKDARFLAEKLLQLRPHLRIDYEDEAYTTSEAEQRLHERGLDTRQQRAILDSVAAQVILEGWLGESRSGTGGDANSTSG